MKIYALFYYGYDLKEFIKSANSLYDVNLNGSKTLFRPQRLSINLTTHANHFCRYSQSTIEGIQRDWN